MHPGTKVIANLECSEKNLKSAQQLRYSCSQQVREVQYQQMIQALTCQVPYCSENFSVNYVKSHFLLYCGKWCQIRMHILKDDVTSILYCTGTKAVIKIQIQLQPKYLEYSIIDKHQLVCTFSHSKLYQSKMLISMLKYIKIFKGTPTCFDLKRSSSGSSPVPR